MSKKKKHEKKHAVELEPGITWMGEVEPQNYTAAFSYLKLTYNEQESADLVASLLQVPIVKFAAKDIFRASRLKLLDRNNYHVKKNIVKIEAGEPMSPILMVRVGHTSGVIITDGYHRLCAVYAYDEDAIIPCKIV